MRMLKESEYNIVRKNKNKCPQSILLDKFSFLRMYIFLTFNFNDDNVIVNRFYQSYLTSIVMDKLWISTSARQSENEISK